jgi:hypothetical protein
MLLKIQKSFKQNKKSTAICRTLNYYRIRRKWLFDNQVTVLEETELEVRKRNAWDVEQRKIGDGDLLRIESVAWVMAIT